jgi:hypothetical protein
LLDSGAVDARIDAERMVTLHLAQGFLRPGAAADRLRTAQDHNMQQSGNRPHPCESELVAVQGTRSPISVVLCQIRSTP